MTRPTAFYHQTAEVAAHGRDVARAIAWEQGTGKTRLTIDTAEVLLSAGEIDAVMVVAPNDVHRNWAEQELPLHAPGSQYAVLTYYTSRAATQKWAREVQEWKRDRRPRWLITTYDAIMTERGHKLGVWFLKTHRALMVLDESAAIKSPGAKRTQRIVALGRHATYRRWLNGTPGDSPMDLYAQVKFLHGDFWADRGLSPFSVFQSYFGIFEKRRRPGTEDKTFDHLVAYRHIDELKALVSPILSRVTKEQVLDLPPKLYAVQRFELPSKTRQVYEEVKHRIKVELAQGTITTSLAIVRLLRLQQIACGHYTDDNSVVHTLDEKRLDVLCEVLAPETPTIIWSRFRADVDAIHARVGGVRYYGGMGADERRDAVNGFQSGKYDRFIATRAAARGLTLHRAKTVIYYSNSYQLIDRLQSEDRAHRAGVQHPVYYVDLIAERTVDEQIAKALRNKYDIMAKLTGDVLREWLE